MPGGVLVPACDADVVDVVDQDGQSFFEESRLDQQAAWATSLRLEGANHNNANSVLGPDAFPLVGRPDCEDPLGADQQREVTGDFAVDVLSVVFGTEGQAAGAMDRLGIDVRRPAAATLYGQDAQSAFLPPVPDRVLLMTPTDAQQLQGEGIETTYCPPGYHVPDMDPVAVPCRRVVLVVPGQPAHAIASWQSPGGPLLLPVPPEQRDFGSPAAVSVRAVIDPCPT